MISVLENEDQPHSIESTWELRYYIDYSHLSYKQFTITSYSSF